MEANHVPPREDTVTCLQVTTRDGRVLLELDEHGQIVTVDESLTVENMVPARIAAAAGGGLDIHHLPPELPVVFVGDVDLVDFGMSALENQWIKLGVPDEMDFDAIWSIRPDELRARLEGQQSTLRAVIFEADIVHVEDEPASKMLYEKQALEMHRSDFLLHPSVVANLPMAGGGKLPASLSEERVRRGHQLAHFLGQATLAHVDPAHVYLWAVDHGVADYLPECYRNAMHHEEMP